MIEDRYSRRWRTRLPFVLLAALLLAAFGIGTASALAWQTETAVSDGEILSGGSLALDSAGHPHVCYVEAQEDVGGDGVVVYVSNDGTSWSSKTYLGDDVGYPCLALDSAGLPRISYYNVMAFAVQYTAFDGTSWDGEFVNEESDCQPYSSLALDSAGNPRISYATWGFGSDSNTLKYAAYDGSAWQVTTVDPEGGAEPSLAIDGSGAPRIAYTGKDAAGDSVLRYAALEGTTWTITTVDTGPGGDNWWLGLLRQPSLKLDGAGRPRVAYTDSSTGDSRIKYASYDSTSWTVETVDPAGGAAFSQSLALNAAGQPRISYRGADGNLRYAWSDGSSWQSEVVGAASAGWNALALDSAGNPRIAYIGDGDLKYAWSGAMPAQAIVELRKDVTALGLPAAVQKGMTDKLDAAVNALDRNNRKTAINNLNAFISLARAQTGKSLTAAQAEALTAEAKRIVAAV